MSVPISTFEVSDWFYHNRRAPLFVRINGKEHPVTFANLREELSKNVIELDICEEREKPCAHWEGGE